ncbi:hypothetical protein F2P81_001280 [Scophthalmus maximus]|uniref:Mediator of RNA polymerase II transcription subunit 10 n=1 Tax=Scophthalmus maximus TaxID=52904 RepID=A0A6A4TL78_SCOMX|nr:hypothetical protein F2P81_001280 [Scophthalmus maximus]
MAEKFDNLEEHLEKFIENIRQLGIIVSDFQPSSQAGLNQKLNFMISGLQDIEKCRQQLHEINVPLEVFEYIDQGRNPQLYTKECLERALARNEQVKGKIDTMTSEERHIGCGIAKLIRTAGRRCVWTLASVWYVRYGSNPNVDMASTQRRTRATVVFF